MRAGRGAIASEAAELVESGLNLLSKTVKKKAGNRGEGERERCVRRRRARNEAGREAGF